MNSNIYRFSIIGETLVETLKSLQNEYKLNEDAIELLLDKFD